MSGILKVHWTRELAHAAAWDEGNCSMRKSGRLQWNYEDSNVCAKAFLRFWSLENDYPWATAEQIVQMRRELGFPQEEAVQ